MAADLNFFLRELEAMEATAERETEDDRTEFRLQRDGEGGRRGWRGGGEAERVEFIRG